MAEYVGACIERVEDQRLLTGRGRYVDDLDPPGTLTAYIVRSSHAHARLRGIDLSDARTQPGVHAAYSAADLPSRLRDNPFPALVPTEMIAQPWMYHALAREEACYVGEPIAVIVADSRALAEDAAEYVRVDYEPLPVAVDCRDAVAPGAPLAHAGAPDNVAAMFTVGYGDTDAALARAPHRLHESIRQHRGCGHAMEGRGVLAVHDPVEGGLRVWSATQAPHGVKVMIVLMLGLDETKVRVVAPDVGGGFGPKGMMYPEDVLVPWLATQLGRPVRWIEDRHEQSIATTQERDQYCEVDVGFDEDGRLLAVDAEVIHDNGAYLPLGIVTPMIGATTLPGPYVLPAYRLNMTVALTNKVAGSQLRGAGRPQAVFVMERLMDRIAQTLGLDRAVVRERNLIRPEQLPYNVGLIGRDGSKVSYDSGDYPRCQAMALERADYAGFSARQLGARGQSRHLGIGIANYVEATGLGPFEGATVRVLASGKIGVFIAAASQGQGHQTVFTQVAADAFGTSIDQIEVIAGDTDRFPVGIGTFASRVAVAAGSAVHNAAGRLREQVLALAASTFGVDEERLVIGPGVVHVVDSPDKAIPLAELLRLSFTDPGFTYEGDTGPGLAVTDFFVPPQSTYSNGTHVVEVEVDPDTGRVNIVRYTVAHDCGTVINPLIVEGQVLGGVAHGIGNALLEYMRYDHQGQPLTTTLEDYLLPAIGDIPRVDIVHLCNPSPHNPLGVKGVGEGGTIPAAAAVISAIEDALSPFGATLSEAPLTAERLCTLAASRVPGDY